MAPLPGSRTHTVLLPKGGEMPVATILVGYEGCTVTALAAAQQVLAKGGARVWRWGAPPESPETHVGPREKSVPMSFFGEIKTLEYI
jgi:hypothetical protein